MNTDDLDDFLDGNRAELEARFEELEKDAEIDRMRAESGAPPPRREPAGGSEARNQAASDEAARAGDDDERAGDDPLSGMKDAMDSDGELERYLLVLCPACDAKNRMSLDKVRTAAPICGRCKKDLSFTKF